MIKIADVITLKNNQGKEHIYFVIGKHGDRFLIVNATSFKPNKDSSCMLNSTDHPFIRKKTIVNYGDALTAKETIIEKNISLGISRRLPPIKGKVLERIIEGALKSDAFPGKYRVYVMK